jgi:hypothetical protein
MMSFHVEYRGGVVNVIAGDLGVAGKTITVRDPWDNVFATMSGSKPEHGPGGFEVIAPNPHTGYTFNALNRILTFEHRAGMTFITVDNAPEPEPEPEPEPTPETETDWEAFFAALFERLDRIIAILEERL